jgi:hypothetical protein
MQVIFYRGNDKVVLVQYALFTAARAAGSGME